MKNLIFAGLLVLTTQAFAAPEIEQLLNGGFNTPYTATFSANGEIAFLMRTSGTGQLWKTTQKGEWPSQLTYFSEPIESTEWGKNSYVWSPTGKELAISLNPGGAQKNQVYRVPAQGGPPVKISTHDDATYRLGVWSPDGAKLSWASNERDNRYYDLYVYDVKAGQARRLYETTKSLDILDWSPDGKCLLVKHLQSDIIHDLLVVDVESGDERLVSPHIGAAQYFGQFGTSCDEIIAITDAETDFIGLQRIDVKEGKAKWLKQIKGDAEGLSVSAKAKKLAVSWNTDGYSTIKIYDWNGKELRQPPHPKGTASSLSLAKDGKSLLYAFSTPKERASLYVYGLGDKSNRQITKPSMAGLNKGELVEPRLIRYKSFDGVEIAGWLYTPSDKPKNTPLVIMIHGGPEAQERPYFSPLAQYMVGQGIAVFAPNIRGSTGYGKKFNQMDNGAKRPDAMRDIVSGTEYLIQEGIANRDRIAIMGGSYGGFAVLYMVTNEPQRWAAAIDNCGIANFETYFKNTSPARVPLRALEYGDPVNDQALLKSISPFSKVDKIQAPMMIIQGANDPVVPKIESDQIVESLKKRGLPVEYLLFPDEGHGQGKRPNIIKSWTQQAKFLKTYLVDKK